MNSISRKFPAPVIPRRALLLLAAAGILTVLALAGALAGRHAAAQNPTLYWGSSGDQVYRVQQRLSQWGYYNGPLTSYYGAETFRAVQSFQRRNGLVPDGVVGPATWGALGYHAQPRTAPAVARGAASDRVDVNLLARVIEGEAGGEPYMGKVAVGAVIMNRIKSSSFPNSLSGVVYQDHAFEAVANGQINRPLSQESVQAAQMAMTGYDPTGGALFFWNPAKPVSPWIWTRRIITRIGNHVFGV